MALLEDDFTRLVEEFKQRPATVDTSLPFAEANRVNAGAALRGSNTQATIDAEGRTVITGSGSPVPTTLGSSISSEAPVAVMTYENFAKARSSLSSITDIEERGTRVAELIGSVQAHTAKQYGEISKTANAMYGVPELEKTLEQAIVADKADPNYQLFLSDSPITAKIRTDLEQARTLAMGKSKDLYAQNPELARLETEAKMLGESEVRLMGVMENRSYKSEAKAMQEIAKAGSNGVKIAELVDPSLDSDEKKATWFNNKIHQDPDLGVLANNMNSPEGLIDSVLYTKSSVVPDVVASLHAKAMAPNNPALQEVEKNKAFVELSNLRKNINNPMAREKILEAVYPAKLERDAKIAALQKGTMNMSPKDAAAAETAFYRDIALKGLSNEKTNTMRSDVTSWDAASVENMNNSPSFSPILNDTKKLGIAPSVANLVATIYKIPDLPTRQARMTELRQYANTATNQQNKGLFGQVDFNALESEIARAQMTAMGIEARESFSIGGTFQSYFAQPPLVLYP